MYSKIVQHIQSNKTTEQIRDNKKSKNTFLFHALDITLKITRKFLNFYLIRLFTKNKVNYINTY